jgi:hypothetical protein
MLLECWNTKVRADSGRENGSEQQERPYGSEEDK